MPFLVLRTVRALWFHAFVRIISSHEKTGTKGPVFPMPDDIRRGRKLSAARSSDILRGSYRFSPQSSASSQVASLRRPVIIQQHARVCQGVFQKYLADFRGEAAYSLCDLRITDRGCRPQAAARHSGVPATGLGLQPGGGGPSGTSTAANHSISTGIRGPSGFRGQ